MAIELTLSVTEDGAVRPTCAGELLAEPTPLADLPRITPESNPFRRSPVELGHELFEAMGGAALVQRLRADPDNRLLLVADASAAEIPWEYAADADGHFLAVEYEFLRLLPNARPAQPVGEGQLNFIALTADPLVSSNKARTPRTGYKLDAETEIQAIQRALRGSGTNLVARRIPPTRKRLQSALRTGPAILHLSCHGDLIRVEQGDKVRQQAVLILEDQDGVVDPLRGDHFTRVPRGVLRLLVMSACHTAASPSDASLARAMVAAAVPAAIGMQGPFPDDLSDDFAATLYEFLLAGHSLGEALRQARWAMEQHSHAVGMPVAYIAPGGDEPLPVGPGHPSVRDMSRTRYTNLPPALQPPRPLLGRERELYALAHAFTQGHKVVTVVGTGGIGKTALSAAFAERFGWRFGERAGGVIGYSFAEAASLSTEALFASLLARLLGPDAARETAEATAAGLVEQFLAAAVNRQPLILLDNYETVLQALAGEVSEDELGAEAEETQATPEMQAAAEQLHRSVARLADAGLPLLLTSRRQPAGLRNESVFPRDRALGGVQAAPGAALFLAHSTRAKAGEPRHIELALEVARATDGHPLAISLLAGEFDVSAEKTPQAFLATWDEELAAARRPGLSAHHVTLTTALERSLEHLSETQRTQLLALSRFPAPFFAVGAALLWRRPEPEDEDELEGVRAELHEFVRRSLLRVEGEYAGTGEAATYRLEPVIGRYLRRRLTPNAWADLDAAYAAYANWLVGYAYGETGQPAVAYLVGQWLDELVEQVDAQSDGEQPGYCWRLGSMLGQYGRITEEQRVLAAGKAAAVRQNDDSTLARIMREEAGVMETRGNVREALALYEQSRDIFQQLGDVRERAVTLGDIARLKAQAGDVAAAQALHEERLAVYEQLGDVRSRAVTLGDIARLKAQAGDVAAAQALHEEQLDIFQQLGDVRERAVALAQLGQLAQLRGDVATARHQYQAALAAFEQLGVPEAEVVRRMLADLQGGDAPRGLTPEEALAAATRAAVEARAGARQAVAELAQHPDVPDRYAPYLRALGDALEAPEPDDLDALYAAAEDLLEELAGDSDGGPRVALELALARLFDRHALHDRAVDLQARAVAELRQRADDAAAAEALSVALFNQAGYLAQLERFDEAVAALEEVVAIDERFGLDDLASDRQALDRMRRRRDGLPPVEPDAPSPAEVLAALESQIAELPPEEQAQLRQVAEDFARLSPDEQRAVLLRQQRQQIAAQADQVAEAAVSAAESGQVAELVPQLEEAAYFADGEEEGSPYAQLARFIEAVVALLKGEPVPPVSSAYVERLAGLKNRIEGGHDG